MIFTSTIFENNKGTNGAAIYTLNTPLTVISCTFKNNKASEEGGAIYFSTEVSDTTSILTLDSSIFKYNSARIGGAYRL